MVLIIVTLAGRFKTNKMRTSEHEEEGDTMPENNESRKVNLADAIRQSWNRKQQNASANKPGQFQAGSAQK